eukprot:292907-Amphidinium_carterae.1
MMAIVYGARIRPARCTMSSRTVPHGLELEEKRTCLPGLAGVEILCGSMAAVELPMTHLFAPARGQLWAEGSWSEPGSLVQRSPSTERSCWL